MEVKKNKSKGRTRFLWVLLVINVVLIGGIWQYHRLIVEVTDGAATDIYRQLMRPFSARDIAVGQPLRIALFESEATAATFGVAASGYYALLSSWEDFLRHENFRFTRVNEIPTGEEAERYNLLILPATRAIGLEDREAVKAFLRSEKGVLMTWAAGTHNEYGQWEAYSLLHEIGGMEIAGTPPVTRDNTSTVMLSGGYPLTANLYPGFQLDITAFDHPIVAHVREDRTHVDGVWTDKVSPTYELHSVRDRAAIVHGHYSGGRFVWTGFTIGSSVTGEEQRDAFMTLLRSSMMWAGHQVQAFKPAWPRHYQGVLSVTMDIESPDDVDRAILDVLRRHRVPVTSFIRPFALREHPDKVALLVSAGEVGLLGDANTDYQSLSMEEQQLAFQRERREVKNLTGRYPRGFRFPSRVPVSDHAKDALVREGFVYFSRQEYDRMVPKPIRSHRRIPLVTRPHILWWVPEVPYLPSGHPVIATENTMTVHFSQIMALGGLYNLSFRPSSVGVDFPSHLNSLITMAKSDHVPVLSLENVIDLWEGWANIRVDARYVSPRRTTLRISNTWVERVENVIVNIEMPEVLQELDLESMTLGTALTDRMSSSGVRWQLHLDRLGPGKNVTYYINMRQPRSVRTTPSTRKSRGTPVGEAW